jgi:hypothetical protein
MEGYSDLSMVTTQSHMAAFLSHHLLVLYDKLVSLTFNTFPFGFYGGQVDTEQMRHPRLEPVP